MRLTPVAFFFLSLSFHCLAILQNGDAVVGRTQPCGVIKPQLSEWRTERGNPREAESTKEIVEREQRRTVTLPLSCACDSLILNSEPKTEN